MTPRITSVTTIEQNGICSQSYTNLCNTVHLRIISAPIKICVYFINDAFDPYYQVFVKLTVVPYFGNGCSYTSQLFPVNYRGSMASFNIDTLQCFPYGEYYVELIGVPVNGGSNVDFDTCIFEISPVSAPIPSLPIIDVCKKPWCNQLGCKFCSGYCECFV